MDFTTFTYPLSIDQLETETRTTQKIKSYSSMDMDTSGQRHTSHHSKFIKELLRGVIPADHNEVLERVASESDSTNTKHSKNNSAGKYKKTLFAQYGQRYADLHAKAIKTEEEEIIYQQLAELLKYTPRPQTTAILSSNHILARKHFTPNSETTSAPEEQNIQQYVVSCSELDDEEVGMAFGQQQAISNCTPGSKPSPTTNQIQQKRHLSDDENSQCQQCKQQISSLKSQLQEEKNARLQAETQALLLQSKECSETEKLLQEISQLRREMNELKNQQKSVLQNEGSATSTNNICITKELHLAISELVQKTLEPILQTLSGKPKRRRNEVILNTPNTQPLVTTSKHQTEQEPSENNSVQTTSHTANWTKKP